MQFLKNGINIHNYIGYLLNEIIYHVGQATRQTSVFLFNGIFLIPKGKTIRMAVQRQVSPPDQ